MKKSILSMIILLTSISESKIIRLSDAQKLSIIEVHKETLDAVKKDSPVKMHKTTDKRIKTAKKYLGTKYKLGASSKSTKRFDCSSFVQRIYKDKKLPRTSYTQIKVGKKKSKSTAKKGDLIFFGDNKRYVGHVGIIIDPKRKLMIHASSARGKVVISSYNTKYYNRKFRGIREI